MIVWGFLPPLLAKKVNEESIVALTWTFFWSTRLHALVEEYGRLLFFFQKKVFMVDHSYIVNMGNFKENNVSSEYLKYG